MLLTAQRLRRSFAGSGAAALEGVRREPRRELGAAPNRDDLRYHLQRRSRPGTRTSSASSATPHASAVSSETASFLSGKPESRRMTVSVVLRNVGGRAVRVHTMEQTRGCPGDEDAQKEKSQLIASRGGVPGPCPGFSPLHTISAPLRLFPVSGTRHFDVAATTTKYWPLV